ncbi:MAG: hypothetical protein AB7E79_17210 [Rhodospirillaceae bacterium]
MSEKTDYSGMTLNERLFASGQMQVFDLAARRRDRLAMIRILKALDVPDAECSADAILAHPEQFGL